MTEQPTPATDHAFCNQCREDECDCPGELDGANGRPPMGAFTCSRCRRRISNTPGDLVYADEACKMLCRDCYSTICVVLPIWPASPEAACSPPIELEPGGSVGPWVDQIKHCRCCPAVHITEGGLWCKSACMLCKDAAKTCEEYDTPTLTIDREKGTDVDTTTIPTAEYEALQAVAAEHWHNSLCTEDNDRTTGALQAYHERLVEGRPQPCVAVARDKYDRLERLDRAVGLWIESDHWEPGHEREVERRFDEVVDAYNDGAGE